MEGFTEQEARQYSPLTLAFLGDSVYELLLRDSMVRMDNRPARDLHAAKIRLVCAAFQARAADRLHFTPEEEAVYRRSRNATGNTVPKHASAADYRKATGLEAVFGYLHLCGDRQRIEALFGQIWEMQDELLPESTEKE
ncbi:MAG: ribonuclease III [Oscillospiraceae bacterium]|nr:ribonuclease III [Oscillospiraceae bacterium]